MNPVLRFPVSDDFRNKAFGADARPEPTLQTFGRDDSKALLGVARKVHDGTKTLLDLVDGHRTMAHDAGIETISIELGSERNSVRRILDALEDAEAGGSDVQLSLEGVELLRRTEKLVAEAQSNLARFVGPAQVEKAQQEAEKAPNLLGKSTLDTDTLMWGSVIIFGVIMATVAIIAVQSVSSGSSASS